MMQNSQKILHGVPPVELFNAEDVSGAVSDEEAYSQSCLRGELTISKLIIWMIRLTKQLYPPDNPKLYNCRTVDHQVP